MCTLRTLDAALAESGKQPNPAKIDAAILNRAAQIAVEHYSPKLAYNIGRYLEELAEFMSEKQLLIVPVSWRNPVKRPEDTDRIGTEHDERRQKKMPTNTVLEVLPKIYLMAIEPVDIMISSIALLLLAAPNRINELLLVSTDCEAYMKQQEGKKTAYGLRWRTSKGAAHMVKWMIPSMHELVQEAIGKIRKITDRARHIAIWYENHPDKVYFPVAFEYLRKMKMIPLADLIRLFQLRDMAAAKDWCWSKKIKLYQENGTQSLLFADFEKQFWQCSLAISHTSNLRS